MRRRRVGSSGLSVSRLGLGTFLWGSVVDDETGRDLLVAYAEAGGTLLDTGNGYGEGASESLIGRLLGDVVDRDDVVICTKAGVVRRDGQRSVDTSRQGLLGQLDQSLRRLSTDHVDLWLVHRWATTLPSPRRSARWSML